MDKRLLQSLSLLPVVVVFGLRLWLVSGQPSLTSMHKTVTQHHTESIRCDGCSDNVNLQNMVFVVVQSEKNKTKADTVASLQFDSRLKTLRTSEVEQL